MFSTGTHRMDSVRSGSPADGHAEITHTMAAAGTTARPRKARAPNRLTTTGAAKVANDKQTRMTNKGTPSFL
ncbi:hypothetical protein GCM10027289_13470 [Tsukamurella serpentis]